MFNCLIYNKIRMIVDQLPELLPEFYTRLLTINCNKNVSSYYDRYFFSIAIITSGLTGLAI